MYWAPLTLDSRQRLRRQREVLRTRGVRRVSRVDVVAQACARRAVFLDDLLAGVVVVRRHGGNGIRERRPPAEGVIRVAGQHRRAVGGADLGQPVPFFEESIWSPPIL